jgi:hypothetical protein
MPDRPEPRFFFVHVQKTAGTSLLIRLANQFPESAIYPDDSDGDKFGEMPQFDIPQLLDRWAVRAPQIRVVTGHFPLCTTELLGGGFTTFTVLREPVERTLSYLRHHRKYIKESRKSSLEDIYADPLRFDGLVHNHMVKMFSLRVDEMTGGAMTAVRFTQEHLERAKVGLAGVDVVGLQEQFDDFCAELEQRFGWDLGEPVVANHTEPADASDELRERIVHDNALDVELYEYARRLVARRRSAEPTS